MASSHKNSAINVNTTRAATELRRRKVLNGLIAGKSLTEAALDAGYSESTAAVACRDIMPHIREAFQEAMHRRIPIGKLAETISAGMTAEETQFFQKDGVVTDERNVIAWSERRRYSELASRLMNLEPPREVTGSDGGPIQFTLVTEHVGRTR